MRSPRGLSPEEAALWARVAATVKPIKGRKRPDTIDASPIPAAQMIKPPVIRKIKGRVPAVSALPPPSTAPSRPLDRHGLDASWDRRLETGTVAPDFTLDLHGHSLDAAWTRLEHGLTLARAQGARVVLVITGRPRPVDAADRGVKRGAIRAKLLDWLASGNHASKIAAVRLAHPRHGGAGAVYVVLKRVR